MQKPSEPIGESRSKSGILRRKNTPKTSFGVSAIVTCVDSESLDHMFAQSFGFSQ